MSVNERIYSLTIYPIKPKYNLAKNIKGNVFC